MRQLMQSYKTGDLEVVEVPPPGLLDNGLLVNTQYSLISAGTEKMMLELGKKSLLGKAKARPDLVKKVLQKVKQEGLFNTWGKVKSKLDTPVPLGYSCVGTVLEVGKNVSGFSVGDIVACAGAGYASHSECNYIPSNLAVKMPEGVSVKDAAYVTVGAIAMQGVRQADVRLGEKIVVLGLGLLGLITVQLLKASGCNVLGFDPDPSKVEEALKLGCDQAVKSDVEGAADEFTKGYGADSVIITASTKSSGPVETAGEITRAKGKVVVVGMVGMEVPRNLYYSKELDLRLSMSYGPGRYDPSYEEGGIDYPYQFVRWTENRNMESFLELIAQKRIDVDALTTHTYKFDQVLEAYKLFDSKEKYIGIVLEYDQKAVQASRTVTVSERSGKKEKVVIGLVGGGNFAKGVLLPAFKANKGFEFAAVCDADSLNARNVAAKFGFAEATSSFDEIIDNEKINTVILTTPHNLHGEQILAALEAGKHVYSEKPLAIKENELEEIDVFFRDIGGIGGKSGTGGDDGKTSTPSTPSKSSTSPNPSTPDEAKASSTPSKPSTPVTPGASAPLLMAGYNRRFSGILNDFKQQFASVRSPLAVNYRINAGIVPNDHWIQDPEIGGGRILGEVCHFVDLCGYLVDDLAVNVYAASVQSDNSSVKNDDSISITLKYGNGAIANIAYLALGDTAYPKERIEVIGGGMLGVLDNFKSGFVSLNGSQQKLKRYEQDKGFNEEVAAFLKSISKGEEAPIPWEQLYNTSKVTFAILESLRSGTSVKI